MSSFTNPLNSIRIASPCSADWNAMIGNNQQRYCGQCKLNVYNLSGMTKRQAENLILNSEGRLCARFFRRADGTIITKDCPVGWAAVKKRMSRVWTAVASVILTAASGIGIVALTRQSEPERVMGLIPITRVPVENEPLMGAVAPEYEPPVVQHEPVEIMGDIAYPAEDESMMGEVMVGRIKTR